MTDSLSLVRAQDTAVATLRRALQNDHVHHAYLFDGPSGVGKELAAFGLAQALVCETRATERGKPGDAACGICSACTRALLRPSDARPLHPDVVVLERGLYEPAQIGRRTPETQDLSIDQVRALVLARAAFPPHEGRAKVFLIRRAEELSVAAANALLKTLEEPGRSTHFVLLTSRPDELLSTIRSRTQRVRFAELPEDVVRDLLVSRGTAEPRAREIAALAGGSMEQALGLADPEESEARETFVRRAVDAMNAADLSLAFVLAEEAKKEKDGLRPRLVALARHLAAETCAHAGASGTRADTSAARHRLVLAAADQLDGNASAQLVVESMFIRMRSA